jgi:putative DNA primase/helicase
MAVSSADWSGPVVALEAPTGLGKTKLVLDQAKVAVADGRRVAIAVSTHELADEQVEKLRAEGISAQAYRGLAAVDPLAPDFPMCRLANDAARLRAGGGDINLLCAVCEHKENCGYRRQMSYREKTDVWVIPHNLLGHARPRHTIRRIDVLIVDENPIFALVQGFDNNVPSLSVVELEYRLSQHGRPWVRRRLARVLGATQIGTKLRNLGRMQLMIAPRHMFWRDLPDAVIEGAMQGVSLELSNGLGSHLANEIRREKRELPKNDIRQALENAAYNERLLLEATAYKLLENGGHGLRVVEVIRDGVPERRLEVRKKLAIRKDWRVPTLLLDATPNWDVYKQFWPIDKMEVAGAASDHMSVRQVTWPASKSKLSSGPHAQANLAKLRRYIEARAAGNGRVLLVAQKAVKEALVALGLPTHVETAHFNAIRGLDRWKDVELLIVVGRTEAPPQAVELLAEVIFQEDVHALPAGEYYLRRPVGLTMAGPKDHAPAVQASYHPDERVEAVRWLITEAELMQAIGRGRGLRRTGANPLQIDLINTVPLPVRVDDVLTWDEAKPHPLHVIAGRYNLILDPDSRYLGTAIRALLPDAAASASSLQRIENTALSGHLPNKEFPISKWPLKPVFSEGRLYVGEGIRSVSVRFQRRTIRQLRPDETPHPKAEVKHFAGQTWVYEPHGSHEAFDPPLYLTKTRPRGRPKARSYTRKSSKTE